jgi:hypothetical protein
MMSGVPFAHVIAPTGFTVSALWRILGFHGTAHGPVEGTVLTIVMAVTNPLIDQTGLHPDAWFFLTADAGDFECLSFMCVVSVHEMPSFMNG